MAGGTSSFADEDDGSSISEINVTPLVDVVLVLLIVFMITMPTIVAIDALNEREIALLLPAASEADQAALVWLAYVVEQAWLRRRVKRA